MLSDSCGRPGFKSWLGGTLKTCNFEALEVTAMYFTFSETSNLYLNGTKAHSNIGMYQNVIWAMKHSEAFVNSHEYTHVKISEKYRCHF